HPWSSPLIKLPHTQPSLLTYYTHPPTIQFSTLSLHDALPISKLPDIFKVTEGNDVYIAVLAADEHRVICNHRSRRRLQMTRCSSDRKSTRLNSSHVSISYAVFCLKKKNK